MTGILGNSLWWSVVWCALVERGVKGAGGRLQSALENKTRELGHPAVLHPLVWTCNWGAQGRKCGYWDKAFVQLLRWFLAGKETIKKSTDHQSGLTFSAACNIWSWVGSNVCYRSLSQVSDNHITDISDIRMSRSLVSVRPYLKWARKLSKQKITRQQVNISRIKVFTVRCFLSVFFSLMFLLHSCVCHVFLLNMLKFEFIWTFL